MNYLLNGGLNLNLKSKMFVLLILLLLILSISSANAENATDSNTISLQSNNDMDIDSDNSMLESSISNETTLTDSPKTFTDLQNLIDTNDGTIDLQYDYKYDSVNDGSALLKGVVINKSITLNGAGHYVDGSYLARIFNISADNVVVKNLMLTNGYKQNNLNASGICWTGNNGLLESCNFTNLYQKDTPRSQINGWSFENGWARGLCVHYSGSNFIINDCTFKLTNTSSTRMFSGVFVTGSDISILNSRFQSLNENIYGENIAGVLNISGCNISGTHTAVSYYTVSDSSTNPVSHRGWNLYFKSTNDIIFEGNRVTVTCSGDSTHDHYLWIETFNVLQLNGNYFNGGVVNRNINNQFRIVKGKIVNMTYNNITRIMGIVNIGEGSARLNVFNMSGNIISELSYNHGGGHNYYGIYTEFSNNSYGVHTQYNMFYGTNGVFFNNTIVNMATTAQGRFYLGFTDAIFYNNTFKGSQVRGRVFETSNGNYLVENNTFNNCVKIANDDYGFIAYLGTKTIFNNNTFNNCYNSNVATTLGGLLYVQGQSNVTDCKFINCRSVAATSKGVVYNVGNGVIRNNTFINNNCTGIGVCIYNTASNINISENTFNISVAPTAALYNIGNNVNITCNKFNNNHADECSGAIYTTGNNVRILNNTINNSTCSLDVGAIYITGTNCIVSDNNFTNCSAINYGAIRCENAVGTIFYNNTFSNNNASDNGIFSLDSDGVTVYYQNFTFNNVSGYAGVISISGSNNILNNLSIYNCSAGVSGGAIYNTGVGNNLSNLTIYDTKAITGFGGAIYSIGNNLTINSLTIYNSSASRDGGAIYISGQYTNISTVVFDNISSGYDGGAVYWAGSNGALNDVNITNVNATHNGGAIYWSANEGTISFINITNSNAGGDGGAIYWTGNQGTANNITLFNISANNGGAIYWTGPYGSIHDSNFEFIRATGDGGAIYWLGIHANLTSINFTNINSSINGGAIFGTGSYSNFDDLTFNDINASANGGAISWSGSDTYLSNMIFNNINAPANGGAIYWTGDRSRIKSSKFENITAGGNGGVIYWTGSYSNLSDVNFTNTESSGSGGSIYWSGINGNVTQANFVNSSAVTGGAISWSADYGILTDANFSDNNATNNGGSINWIGESPTFYNINITNSNATFKGGAIYLIGSNSNLKSLSLKYNNAGADGGALYLDGVNSKLFDSEFINNTANSMGGAVSWLGAKGEFYNCNFTNNTAGTGGAVYISADDNNVHKITFINNTADSMGGALYMAGLAGNNLSDVNFTNNFANVAGGAIYWTSNNAFVNDININNSNSMDGGAIYWNGANSNLTNLTFNNAYSINNGGILYVSSSNVNISNANFTNSNAVNGGAVYWTGHYGQLNNVVFLNNTASNGGALYSIGTNSNVNNATFSNNIASNGGAVYWAGSGNIINSNLSNNNASSGSGAYNIGDLTLINTTLLENNANISSVEIIVNDTGSGTVFGVSAIVRGNDNFLNGIYTTSGNIHVRNVTYWNGSAEVISADELKTPVEGASETELYYDSRLAGREVSITAARVGSTPVTATGYTDINGVFTYDQFLADPGSYKFTAVSKDDVYFSEKSNSVEQYIRAGTANIILDLSSYDFDYNTNITIHLKFQAFDFNNKSRDITPDFTTIKIYVDDEYVFNVTLNGTEMSHIDTLLPVNAGYHNLTAVFEGLTYPEPIDASKVTVNFTVNRIPITLKVSANASTIYVGDSINVSVIAPDIYDGEFTYTAGIYHDTLWGKGGCSFNATYYDEGVVNVIFYAEGDDNYLPGAGNCSFNVIKRNIMFSYVNITGTSLNPIDVGDAAVIKFKFSSDDATGNIIVNIDDNNYTAIVDGEYATVVIPNLTSNDLPKWAYLVLATYSGDNKYYSFGPITALLSVNKIDTVINVSVSDSSISVGENTSCIINISSNNHTLNGFASVNIGDNEYNVSIINNTGYLIIKDLNEGNYTIKVIYSGDYQFKSSFNNDTYVTVNKINITCVEVSSGEAYVGENIKLNITITPNINGFITVTVDNKKYNISIVNGKGVLRVNSLNEGNYNVNVSYIGDNKYNAYNASFENKIIVNKINTNIDFNITSPIYVGQNTTINISVIPESNDFKVNGYVNINVSGKNYNATIVNNTGSIIIYDLNSGKYNVNISYDGNDQFKPSSTLKNDCITVNKINIDSINVTHSPQNAYVGQDIIIDINITPEIENLMINDYLILNINDTEYNIPIINNKGSLTVSNLNYGIYNVNASYNGNDIFNSKSNTKADTISVNKLNINQINVEPIQSSIYVGQNAVFNIELIPADPEYVVNDYVTVSINNGQYNVSIIDGKGTLTLSDLSKGTYSMNVSYDGNSIYNSIKEEKLNIISVEKVAVDVVVSDSNIYVGQDASTDIKLIPDINGYLVNDYVTVKINNVKYNVSIVNNSGVFSIPKLNNGTYDVNVSFVGNNIYAAREEEKLASVIVSKVNISSIIATVEKSPIAIGENAVVQINMNPSIPNYLVNDYVTVTVGNVKYNVSIINNTGYLIVYGLNGGNYNVNVSYAGDDTFNSKDDQRLALISVVKSGINSISVTPVSQIIDAGDNATLNIKVTSSVENQIVDGYVTVSIGYDDYTVSIINGSGVLKVYDLDAGFYNVNVVFDENDLFNGLSLSKIANITVNKANITNIVVTPKNQAINVSDDASIDININPAINDYITVIVNNEEYDVCISYGKGSLSVSGLAEGNYSVDIVYGGNSKFNPYSASGIANITVNKISLNDISVNIVNQSIYVGDDAVFIVTVDSDKYPFNGYVTLSIGDKQYNVSIANNKGYLNISDLDVGDYKVNVTYAGDSKFNSFNKVDAAVGVVNKVNITSITVTPSSQIINVSDSAVLNISIIAKDYVVDGYVVVKVAGVNYTVPIIKNNGSLIVSGLNKGIYHVNVSYYGDYQFNASEKINAAEITVNKINLRDIEVSAVKTPIYVGENAVFNITLVSDYLINDNIIATINNQNYNVSIINNKGVLTVYDLNEGTYNLDVVYNGDDRFNSYAKTGVASVAVKKVDIANIDVNVTSPIYVGQNSRINISLNPIKYTVNGSVLVKVNNDDYIVPITNNVGYTIIEGLSNGTYDVTVTYDGNDQFNSKVATASLVVVNKIPTSIFMNNVSINVGDTANIVAVINNSEVTGNVTFTVNGDEYTVGIINGIASLNVSNLNTSSNKEILASYSGDYKFMNSSTSALLNISKLHGNASIIVHNITAGETETVIINLPYDLTNGTVIVEFNNDKVTDYIVNNNVISFNKTIQASGNYTVTVDMINDSKYDDFVNSSVFSVFKVSSDDYIIVIDVNNTNVFENIPVTVNLPNDANETLTLIVDNETYEGIKATNGSASHTLGNLSSGIHNITVTYDNAKYDMKTVMTSIIVSKIASSINITNPADAKVAHDIIIGIIPESRSTGDINVTINGKKYLVENRSIVNASDLLEGNYTVVVVLGEDDNFLESTNHSVFTVIRNTVFIDLKNITGEIRVGSPVVLHADLTDNVTGSVIFNINGENITVNITEDDEAEYTWIPSADSMVNVSAYYSGNDIYYPASASTVIFDVYKNPISFTDIILSDIMVEEMENITVNLNESDATGIINININGADYEVTIVNGSGYLNISGLNADTYTVIVSYGGDYKYLAANSISNQFTVSKYDAPLTITAEDIMVSDDAVVTVNVPVNTTGYILITVSNISSYLQVINGSVSWKISNLSAGAYNVSAQYSGDYKYSANFSLSSFNVNKHNSTYNIYHEDVGWTGEDTPVSIKLADDATGNVTLTVNGTEYKLPVKNGTVDFVIPPLNAGDYEIIIDYTGDNKYDSLNDKFNFTVNLNSPIILADNLIKYYKGSQRLYINLTNVRGDKLANETLYVTINGIVYSRVTNDNGQCSIPINLLSGEYDAFINYNTSDLYEPVFKIVNITVLHTIIAEDLVKVFCNDSQYMARFTDSEGNALVGVTVTFNINGVFYNRLTNADGWAKLNINLHAGEYIITAYNPVTDDELSNIIKVLPRIVENNDLIKFYRDPSKFTVRIVGDDGKPVGEGVSVDFNVHGVLYTRTTNASGYASLNINLPAGEYIITTYHEGCVVSNTITVLERD